MKRTKRMLCNHECITEEDLNKQDSGEMSNAEQKTAADKIGNCLECRKISREFWARH